MSYQVDGITVEDLSVKYGSHLLMPLWGTPVAPFVWHYALTKPRSVTIYMKVVTDG